jgi:cytochrome P450
VAELFHITERATWLAAAQAGEYWMSTRGIKLEDQGFIHCSLRHQLSAVADIVYGDVSDEDLIVLVIDSEKVAAPIRYEAVEPGGEKYPHLYGALPVIAVIDTIAVDRDATGQLALRQLPRSYPFGRVRLEPDTQYAELRRSEPVCRVQLPYGPPAWLVTNYRLTKVVLGDARFSRAACVGRDNPRESAVDISQVADSILSMDPPAHTRIRRLVGKAFTPRRVEGLRPRAAEIAAGLLDCMMSAGPPADLVGSFSYALPAIMICELLGIPESDRQMFRSWTDAIVSTTTTTPVQEQDAYLHLVGYIAELFAERRARPGDDLVTGLVQARDNDDRLSESELLILAMALLVAGYETTAHQITNMTYTLLTKPSHLEQLRQQPDLIPAAVEEMLRFNVFGSAINPRIATADVQLGDVLVRAGDPVLCSRSSANRDESVFSRPDELDFGRDPNPHLGFGYGPHFCLGANLARMELRVALGTILSRLPGARIAVPEDSLTWHDGTVMRGLAAFPITW